jgi:hypothetical protein
MKEFSRMRATISKQVLSLLAVVLCALVGCGSGNNAVKVTGAVSYDGQPVEKGEIIFTPADGSGQSAASKIENGEYQCQVPPGTHKVRITAYREVPGQMDRSNPGVEVPVVEMYIPDQYNASTTLEVTVDSSKAKHDFALAKG